MLLTLKRPIITLDVETHDKCAPEQARIVELGFVMYSPDGTTKAWSSLVNPGVPIAPDTTRIHGITDEMVAPAPRFAAIAANLVKGFSNCDYAGYNVKFDLRVLQGEMNRNGVKWSYADAYLVDGLRLWQIAEPRTLTDGVKKFTNGEMTEAHRALGDAKDAWSVIEGILSAHEKLPRTVQAIHELCFPRDTNWLDDDGKIVWKGNEAVLSFGRWNGTPLSKVDRGYLNWMVSGEFPEATKVIVRAALDGVFPVKE
jgi:DNA polymerase-3 subunit epsilon